MKRRRLKHLLPLAAAAFGCMLGRTLIPAAEPATTAPATTTAAATTSAPATQAGATYSWDVAKKHVGEKVTIVGPVIGAHVFDPGHNVSLNMGKDFPDTNRFTVYVPGTDQAGMPADMYVGKTIAVTGEVIMYREIPEIKVGTKGIVVQK